MLLSFGLYWSLYGWKFALGLLLSIYIHEMGHVAALLKYGIPASAPMFIPGFGAFIRAHMYPTTPGQDARVGLAGPLWGMGACLFAALVAATGGAPVWTAIARTGAWINLFNLIPVWQLDGARGFRALTKPHRLIVAAAFGVMYFFTTEVLLAVLAVVALYRAFATEAPEEADYPVLQQFVLVIIVLSGVSKLSLQ
jgi:Zn-dependent protease